MQTGDRESTQDWLVPDAPGEEPSVAEPPEAPLESTWGSAPEILAEAERAAEAASAAAERAGISSRAAEAMLERTEAALAVDSAVAEGKLRDLAVRVEVALMSLEARERAAERRAGEAAREEDALRSFSRRADRIVLALQVLEGSIDPIP